MLKAVTARKGYGLYKDLLATALKFVNTKCDNFYLFIFRGWMLTNYYCSRRCKKTSSNGNFTVRYCLAGRFGGGKVWQIWQIVHDSPN